MESPSLNDQQLAAIAELVAAGFGQYHASKSAEESQGHLAQMLLNMTWGSVMAIVVTFGPQEGERLKKAVEERGVAYPTESNLALMRDLSSK